MTTQLTYENPMTTAINDHLYPATSLYIPLVPPPQQQQQPGGVVKQRRRRRKTKNSEGMGQKKRKLSEEQVVMLENSFGSEHKLESERKDKLALELGLDPRQVAVWFQNRRARWKNKKLEDEFSKLNSQHHSTLLEKCNLEAQVMKLKEELKDAQMEIKRLSERTEMITCSTINSPTSSMSMDHAIDPCMIVGDYANLHGFNDLVYFQGESLVESLGWNLYNM